MQSYFFWNNWSREYRYFMYSLLGVFILTILFLWFGYFQGVDGSIHWDKFQDQKTVDSTVDTFSLGPFELNVPAENFIIYEFFNGSIISPNYFASYTYIIILFLAAALLITIITLLPRFWYIVGTVLFILFIYSLRLEVLGIFGLYNDIAFIAISAVIGFLSILFNFFKPTASFTLRLLTFSSTLLIGVTIIVLFSSEPIPLFHLVVTSYPIALGITVLFIFLVAHEILASFTHIIGTGGSGTKNLRHFAILSFIYLANLFISALHEMRIIEWEFIYINPYLLLTISAVLGLWGFREREVLYDNILPFKPFGAYFYLALGLIAFATTGVLLGNSNDSGLRIVRQLTIFSHVGFSFIFFTYILANFISLLGNNLAVNKVLYKPRHMPYFTFQFAGLIATLGFVFFVGWRIYIYESVAGFYTTLGDMDVALDNTPYAKAHYEQARSYSFGNHHANYALGRLNDNFVDLSDMHKYYSSANRRTPSEYSLVNEGNAYLWERDYLQAISKYEDGARKIYNSGYLKNNLGFAYSKILSTDSAVYYLSEAREYSQTKSAAETNFFALAAKEHIPFKADSILTFFNSSYPGTMANALAVANVQGQDFNFTIDPLKKKELDLYHATLLNNYIIKNVKSLDTAFLRKAFEVADDSLNTDYSEALKVAIATAYYYQHNINQSLYIMAELAFISQSYNGKYNYLLGLWALQQGNAERAARYFQYAELQDYKEATLYKAIALTEGAQIEEALIAWDSVATRSGTEATIARRIKSILTMPSSEVISMADPEKYQYCRYQLQAGDTLLFEKIIPTFQDNNYKAQALLDMAHKQFKWDNTRKSIDYLNLTGGLKLTSEKLYQDIRYFELSLLAKQRDLTQLANSINDGVIFNREHALEKIFYAALLNEASNDTLNASKRYEILARYNPYFEEGVMAAAHYFKKHAKDNLKAYIILAEAIQVNNVSPKLLMAYINEANALGFDEYALDGLVRLQELSKQARFKIE